MSETQNQTEAAAPRNFNVHTASDRILALFKDNTDLSGAEIIAALEVAKMSLFTELVGQMMAASTATAIIAHNIVNAPDTAPSSTEPPVTH